MKEIKYFSKNDKGFSVDDITKTMIGGYGLMTTFEFYIKKERFLLKIVGWLDTNIGDNYYAFYIRDSFDVKKIFTSGIIRATSEFSGIENLQNQIKKQMTVLGFYGNLPKKVNETKKIKDVSVKNLKFKNKDKITEIKEFCFCPKCGKSEFLEKDVYDNYNTLKLSCNNCNSYILIDINDDNEEE